MCEGALELSAMRRPVSAIRSAALVRLIGLKEEAVEEQLNMDFVLFCIPAFASSLVGIDVAALQLIACSSCTGLQFFRAPALLHILLLLYLLIK
jgi:hypothetical protein